MVFTVGKYAADLSAATLTDITAGGLAAGDTGTYLFYATNRANVATTLRLAVTTGGAVANGDYIEYDAPLSANGIIRDFPIPLQTGWKVWVYSAAANVSAGIIGIKAA